jgi:histone deacetylase 1/2
MVMLDIPSMPIDQALEDPNEDEDFIDPDDRRPMRLLDARRQADGELSDSDDEGEGGRRNHARYRDRESEELNGSHKFGLGGGILNSGPMNTHGAGPSGHTTAVRILSAAAVESAMDVDTPSAESNTGGSGTDSVAAKPGETAQDDLLAKKEDMEEEPTVDGMDMVVEPVHSP